MPPGSSSGASPGKEIVLVRNPNWDKTTDYRPAYLDEIDIQEGNDDLATASRRALSGSATSAATPAPRPPRCSSRPCRATRTRCVSCRRAARVTSRSTRRTRRSTTSTCARRSSPTSDRNALRLTRGGAVLGDIANGWIPPNIPGFNEAGGLKQNTDLDFLASPTGDPAVAKKYMLAAKKEDPSLPIDANGKWTGEREAADRRRQRGPGQEDRGGLPGSDEPSWAST